MRLRFTIRDLLWLAVVMLAVALGWSLNNRRMRDDLSEMDLRVQAMEAQRASLTKEMESQRETWTKDIGRLTSENIELLRRFVELRAEAGQFIRQPVVPPLYDHEPSKDLKDGRATKQ